MMYYDQTERVVQHDAHDRSSKRRSAESQRGFARRRRNRDIDLSSLTMRVRV